MVEADLLTPLGALRAPLEALGALLAAEGHTTHLVVVGGIAILVRRVRVRATGDVDVFARGEPTEDGKLRLVRPHPLPPPVQDAVFRVARDYGLPPDWLNAVVGSHWDQNPLSLPPGLAEDTTWHTLGGLNIGIAGRRALIALKLYAAVDTGPESVHTKDLLSLRPSDRELAEAVAWVRVQDASEGFALQTEQVAEYAKTNR